MEGDTKTNKDSAENSEEIIKEIGMVVKDPNVQKLLLNELELLPTKAYTLYVAYHKVYIIINFNHYLQTIIESPHDSTKPHPNASDIESKYAIKISKGFPLKNSVKVHLLDGGFQPKICDGRDIFK